MQQASAASMALLEVYLGVYATKAIWDDLHPRRGAVEIVPQFRYAMPHACQTPDFTQTWLRGFVSFLNAPVFFKLALSRALCDPKESTGALTSLCVK